MVRLPHASPRPGHPPHTVCAWLWPRCRCGLRGGHVHGGVCWMRARGRGMTWWARTAQKSGSRLLPNAAVPVWLSSALRTSAMAPEKNLALGAQCVGNLAEKRTPVVFSFALMLSNIMRAPKAHAHRCEPPRSAQKAPARAHSARRRRCWRRGGVQTSEVW